MVKRLLALLLIALLVVIIVRSLPDLRRYRAIRDM